MENLRNDIHKKTRTFVRTSISLPPDLKDFMEQNKVSASEVVQDHLKSLQSGNVGLWRQLQEVSKEKEKMRNRIQSLFKFIDHKGLLEEFSSYEDSHV